MLREKSLLDDPLNFPVLNFFHLRFRRFFISGFDENHAVFYVRNAVQFCRAYSYGKHIYLRQVKFNKLFIPPSLKKINILNFKDKIRKHSFFLFRRCAIKIIKFSVWLVPLKRNKHTHHFYQQWRYRNGKDMHVGLLNWQVKHFAFFVFKKKWLHWFTASKKLACIENPQNIFLNQTACNLFRSRQNQWPCLFETIHRFKHISQTKYVAVTRGQKILPISSVAPR